MFQPSQWTSLLDGSDPSSLSNSSAANTTTTNLKNNPRACESCRTLKVRCLPSSDDSPAALTGQCQRCAKTAKECVFTAPSRTRRRKRTDVRVRELEREVMALSGLLRGRSGFADGETVSNHAKTKARKGMTGMTKVDEAMEIEEAVAETASDQDRMCMEKERESLNESVSQQNATPTFQVPGQNDAITPPPPYSHTDGSTSNSQSPPQHMDVIDRGILSMEKATELFDRFLNNMVQHHPTIFFPPGTSATHLRTHKPTLFLAILSAAAGTSGPQVYRTLNTEILQAYADRIVMRGERSLELIQALLITIDWPYPPDNFEEVKFYQHIHMAATMAMEIGLGKKMRTRTRDSTGVSLGSESSGAGDGLGYDSIESRRTLLACYLNCARFVFPLTFVSPNV
jgi:hypothetical protein